MKSFFKKAANIIQTIQFQATHDKQNQPTLNTKVIKLYDFFELYGLEADSSVTNINKNLYIYKVSGKIKEGQDHLKGNPTEYSGFLGIINVLGFNFLVLVKEVNILFVLDGKDKIFEIASVEFKEINESTQQPKPSKEVLDFLERIDKILSGGGYYFSYKYPITLSQQKMFELLNQQQNLKEQNLQTPSLFHLVDYDYMWNYNLMKPLIQQRISTDWQAQLIQGHVFNFVTYTPNLTYYTLISRRQMRRGGTRFSHRGINSDGYVSNYVETEQILVIPSTDHIISHLQIRGSVPSFWSQKGLSAKIYLDSSKLLSIQACKLHLDYLMKNYNEITFVNLMSMSKSNETKLTKEMIDLVNDGSNKDEKISYVQFDFHHEVKSDKFENIDSFINQNIFNTLQRYGFFVRNTKGDIIKKQNGIIRTNCLDCLDRTNYFQLRIGYNVLTQIIFQELNFKFQNSSDTEKFKKDFQLCWGENGDSISMHYADTSATTSNVTKTGKQGVLGFLKGKLSSARRFFKGNLSDAVKQLCYCIILGEHYETQENLGFQEDLQKELKKRQNEFTITWNLNAFVPEKSTYDLKQIFMYNQKYDIVAIGFQEIVELKPQNLMMSTNLKHNAQKYWQDVILFNIGHKEYFLASSANMVGIQTYIFARNELKDRISDIEFDSVKCGFAGQLGNKGAVAVRFNIDDTSIAILNCHLPAGQSKINDRLSTLAQCQQLAFQQEGMAAYKKEPLSKSDKLILIGDLNFRVDRKYAEVLSIIGKAQVLQQENNLKEYHHLIEDQILRFDQLISIQKLQSRPSINLTNQENFNFQAQRNSFNGQNQNDVTIIDKNSCIKNFYEKNIQFLPTYKFDKDTNIYDTSKKQRVPSYCDRILINDIENENLKNEQQILLYTRCEINISDHKPVCAVIQFEVKSINKEIKDKIIEEILIIQSEKSRDLIRQSNKYDRAEDEVDEFQTSDGGITPKNQDEFSYTQQNQKHDLIYFSTQISNSTYLNPKQIISDKQNQIVNVSQINQNKITSQNQCDFSNNFNEINTNWNFDNYSSVKLNNQSQSILKQKSNKYKLTYSQTYIKPQNNTQNDFGKDDESIQNSQLIFNHDELKDTKYQYEISIPPHNQFEQLSIGRKKSSIDSADFMHYVPHHHTQDFDKPQMPYQQEFFHHQRNSLTNQNYILQKQNKLMNQTFSESTNQNFDKEQIPQQQKHTLNKLNNIKNSQQLNQNNQPLNQFKF